MNENKLIYYYLLLHNKPFKYKGIIYYSSGWYALAEIILLLLVLAGATHSAAFSWQVNWDGYIQKDLTHLSFHVHCHLKHFSSLP